MKMYFTFWLSKLDGRDNLKRPEHRWEENLTLFLKEQTVRVWYGFSWLRIGRSGRLL
jgi:hypothetical protein